MQEDSMMTRVLPANFGPLKDANANARITGPCGDTMEFWLLVRDNRIMGATFITDGCGPSIICGSAAACLASALTLDEAALLTQEEVLNLAGDIPEESRHCALLAVNTLKSAIAGYRAKYEQPQKCAGGTSECGSCKDDSCSANKAKPGEKPEAFMERQQLQGRLCRITHKIMVLSGKGGVGKSTVAVNLAMALSLAGKRVGLLDADMHGPSVSTMLRSLEPPIITDSQSIVPIQINGLKVMSIGYLMPQRDRDEALIWRGPMKMSVIKQFLKDVEWGELDYLVIDLPPGTGDEPLSLCQMIEDAAGAVVVTTPQEVAAADVRKSLNFCRALELPVLGIVENMSGFACPKCNEVTDIFNAGGGERMAREFGVPFLGKIPIDPAVGKSGDEGEPFVQRYAKTETARAFEKVIGPILNLAGPSQTQRK